MRIAPLGDDPKPPQIVAAVPEDGIPDEGVRGQRSDPSDVVSFAVRPTDPPDLAALADSLWGTGNVGVRVETSTSVRLEPNPVGPHQLRVVVAGQVIYDGPLQDVPTDAGEPPAGVSLGNPAVVRGERAGGRTPISVWHVRSQARDVVPVQVRLADPLGRATEQTMTVPGWVHPDASKISLVIEDVSVSGRVRVVRFRSNAPISATNTGTLTISAGSGLRPVTQSFPLHRIKKRRIPVLGRRTQVAVARVEQVRDTVTYGAMIRELDDPIEIAIEMSDGRSATARYPSGGLGRLRDRLPDRWGGRRWWEG